MAKIYISFLSVLSASSDKQIYLGEFDDSMWGWWNITFLLKFLKCKYVYAFILNNTSSTFNEIHTVKSWLDNDSPHFEVFEHETLRNGHGPKIRTNFAKYSTLFWWRLHKRFLSTKIAWLCIRHFKILKYQNKHYSVSKNDKE